MMCAKNKYSLKNVEMGLLLCLMLMVMTACSSPPASPPTSVISEPNQNPSDDNSSGTYTLDSYEFTPSLGADFGAGFSTMHEKFLGVGGCLEFNEGLNDLSKIIEVQPNTFEVDFTTKIANSRKELLDILNMSISLRADFYGGLLSITGKAAYAGSDSINRTKIYLVSKANVRGHKFGFLNLGEEKVRIQGYNKAQPEKSTGFAAMYFHDYKNFLARCGDKFVSSITAGGEFYLVAEIETYSEQHKKKIKGTLEVEVAKIGKGRGSLSLLLDELKSQSNVKIDLFSSGLFPNPQTLLKVTEDPSYVVENLLDNLKEECLSLQNNVSEKASLNYSNVSESNSVPVEGINQGLGLTLPTLLQKLSYCSAQVGLTDYLLLTNESKGSVARKSAVQADYVASRIRLLLSGIASFRNDAQFYISNPDLYRSQNSTPDAVKQHLEQTVKTIGELLSRQLGLCEARNYTVCQEVSITFKGQVYKANALAKLINQDWANMIPPRDVVDLPDTCDDLAKVRGQKESFKASNLYTIFYNHDFRRSYKVFCLQTPSKESVSRANWLDFGENPIRSTHTSNTEPTYMEYVQLASVKNISSAYTNQSLTDFNLNEGYNSQVTRYDRMHVNPKTLTIIPEVTTFTANINNIIPNSAEAKNIFSTFAPQIASRGAVQAVPLGVAASCDKVSATSSISLEGTNLYIHPVMLEAVSWQWYKSALDTPVTQQYTSPRIKTEYTIDERNNRVYGKRLLIHSGNLANACSVITPKNFRIQLMIPVDRNQVTETTYPKPLDLAVNRAASKDVRGGE